MGSKRVVITGMGVVSPFGIGVSKLWNSLISGKSSIKKVSSFECGRNKSQIACEARNIDLNEYIDKKAIKKTSRFIQFALIASKLAIKQAKFKAIENYNYDVGVYIGTGSGGYDVLDREYLKYFHRGPKVVSPFSVTSIIPNMAASYVAIEHGLKGPCVSPVAACASGLYAIIEAADMIRQGRIKAALAGASESSITSFVFSGYESMRALSTKNEHPESASCPFDEYRDGFVMGEGAAILFIEEYDNAIKRGATPIAEIGSGYTTCDAYHIAAPDESGMSVVKTMEGVLRQAEVSKKDISYISAHGTSTKRNDYVEAKAITQLFKNENPDVLVTAIKSMIGHTLGASGAIAALSAACSIRDQIVPGTINTTVLDKDIDINLLRRSLNEAKVEHVIVNSFGFGGHNASLLISKLK